MRVAIAYLLSFHYLAVLLNGSFMASPASVPAVHPYEHATHCQEQNYLLLDCWDKCNKPALAKQTPVQDPLSEAAVVQAGLDVHDNPDAFQIEFPVTTCEDVPHLLASFRGHRKGYLGVLVPPPKLGV